MSKIKVNDTEITILLNNGQDYISLTDMIKAKPGQYFVENWLRNRNTIEFLGEWEMLHNPNFNSLEFDVIKKMTGLNTFNISVKELTAKTNSIGLIAKTGRYGGTYAHRDIAFEFGTWISAKFKLYLIKEFQRLKEEESKNKNLEWDNKRFLSKMNYELHTDAIKENIIPNYKNLTIAQEGFIYASEAEILNVAVFGKTSKQWREENRKAAKDNLNMRDTANIIQLIVLGNLEAQNTEMINKGISAEKRLAELKIIALTQLTIFSRRKYNFPIDSPNINKYKNTDTLK